MANLSDDLKQALCPRPCERVAHTEVELVGGEEILVKGTPPPPLCDSCPHRDSEARPINHVRVVRNAYASEATDSVETVTNVTVLPEAEPEPVAVPVAEAVPEPEDPIFAMQRRYLAQMAEDDRAAGVRKSTGPGGPSLKPEDFGIRP
jgi:hypothetical protein